MEGHAYILLEVEPPNSPQVARELSKRPDVDYAATVWGQWDIVMRVHTPDAESLIELISGIHTEYPKVRRTETMLVRPDQIRDATDTFAAGNWAFLFLQVEGRRTSQVLDALMRLSDSDEEIASIRQAAGVLGMYDIAVTVRYVNDTQLRQLVMGRIQSQSGIAQTRTVTSIGGLVFSNGRPV